MISSSSNPSKSAQHSHRLDALFRHVPSSPSAGLFPAGNPARTHSAAPCELQSACRIFCDSYELCATLSGLDSEGKGTDELSDHASYEAAAQRRLDALRILIERPATTLNLVLAKAFAVSRSADATAVETEAGQLAIGLVRQLEAIGDEQHGRGQVRRPTDIAVAQICRAFFDADRVYQETVSGHQMDHSAIDLARQHRADALALVMSLQASTMADVVAKTEVVLHLFEWVGHDAIDVGQLAIVALRELRSIAGARNV